MTHAYDLDGKRLSPAAAAHAYLKETLGFPAHYGCNLDALYDCLTEDRRETLLWISNSDAADPAIIRVMTEATEANPSLTVILLSED